MIRAITNTTSLTFRRSQSIRTERYSFESTHPNVLWINWKICVAIFLSLLKKRCRFIQTDIKKLVCTNESQFYANLLIVFSNFDIFRKQNIFFFRYRKYIYLSCVYNYFLDNKMRIAIGYCRQLREFNANLCNLSCNLGGTFVSTD